MFCVTTEDIYQQGRGKVLVRALELQHKQTQQQDKVLYKRLNK